MSIFAVASRACYDNIFALWKISNGRPIEQTSCGTGDADDSRVSLAAARSGMCPDLRKTRRDEDTEADYRGVTFGIGLRVSTEASRPDSSLAKQTDMTGKTRRPSLTAVRDAQTA